MTDNTPASLLADALLLADAIKHWLNDRGLDLPANLTFKEWSYVGRMLKDEREQTEYRLFAIQCAIGDWLNYGERHYGEKYAQAVLETGRSYHSLANLAWVTREIKADRRNPELSFAHHAEVAALPETEADELLARAEREHLTAKGLRGLIQDHRVRESGKDPLEERARAALNAARIALEKIPRSARVRMIVERLIKPLADVAKKEREQFLSAVVGGVCNIE